MGRYIDNPMSAQTQVMGNLRDKINMIGQVLIQKKMKEQARKQELADSLELYRGKSEIDLQDPSKQITQMGDIYSALQSIQDYKHDYGPEAEQPMTIPQTPNINIPNTGQVPLVTTPTGTVGGVQPQTGRIGAPAAAEPGQFQVEEMGFTKGGRAIPKKATRIPTEAEKTAALEDRAREEVYKKEGEMKGKMGQSAVANEYNINLVGDAMYDYGQWLVKGHSTGGSGDIYRAKLTDWTRKGYIPDIHGTQNIIERGAEAAAVPGKKWEIILKMFPMMTQQIGEKGSIRLIESVLQRIGVTLPDSRTPIKLAPNMLAGTRQSLYRIQRAAAQIDFSNFDFENDQSIDEYANIIAENSKSIQLSPEEKKMLEESTNRNLAPLNEYLGGGQFSVSEPYKFGASKGVVPGPRGLGTESGGQGLWKGSSLEPQQNQGQVREPTLEEIKRARQQGYTGWDEKTGQFVR